MTDTDHSDSIPESRLRRLYLQRDLTVSETARELSKSTEAVHEALRRTDFYEPETATLLAELDPEAVSTQSGG